MISSPLTTTKKRFGFSKDSHPAQVASANEITATSYSPANLLQLPSPVHFCRSFLLLDAVCGQLVAWTAARMEKPRPRSTGLLRFHGGTSDGRDDRHR